MWLAARFLARGANAVALPLFFWPGSRASSLLSVDVSIDPAESIHHQDPSSRPIIKTKSVRADRMFRQAIVAAVAGFCVLQGAGAQSSEIPEAFDPPAWRHIALDRALSNAASVTDPYRRAEALASIARAQVLVDDTHAADGTIRAALTAAQQITERPFQDWVLQEIVLAQIATDDMIGARQTADRIATERPQGAALAAIAGIQLRGGYLADAQMTALRIRNAAAAGEALRQIVVFQIAMGATTSARETVGRIDDGFYRALASGDLAVIDVHNGDIDSANAMATRTRKAHRSQVYGRIALARVDKGDVSGAMATLAKIDDELYRALVQGRIAAQRAAAGGGAEARQLFASALNLMDGVRDRDHRKALSLSQLARIQAVSGDISGAQECLRRAIAASGAMTNGQQRDDALDVIARSQARIGDSDAALATAMQIRDRVAQALLIRDVIALQTGTSSANAVLHNSAIVHDPLTETAALFGIIGVQLLKDGARSAGAGETIEAARNAVRSIDAPPVKPAALAALAAARVTIGDVAGGWSIFQESLTAADALERQDQRAAAYVTIVSALDDRLIFLGQPARRDIEQVL